ncbi:DedA family protein [Glycomyces buryatensis]|uniref:DedA family protein n=1 Tax=Glycomyces buryatensis TaxID=2570927 RepID=A0A4S8PQR6_9ACTN|nr:hypothetical protein [Glycomyces buryatensis]THV33513.1 hypothetical protein FAB82_25590 [Glycomyces buryatensis]
MTFSLPVVALVLTALVIADFFIPMVPSATTIAAIAGFIVGNWVLIAALVLWAAASSWLGDVVGFRTLRLARANWHWRVRGSAKVAALEERLRSTLTRHPNLTTLVARFVPAGRTALAWAATGAPEYHHTRMAALAAIAWSSYIVGLGLLIGWIFGAGVFSVAMTITSIAAGGFVLGWWIRTKPVPAPEQ